MKMQSKGRPVYIVDGARTPFLKAKGPGPFSSADLAVQVGKTLLNRQSFAPSAFDQVILGSMTAGPDEANIARVVALRLGCGDAVPAFTVMRNCASGMQALDNAASDIASGRSNLILAGGTDAMSQTALLFHKKMATWLTHWAAARGFGKKLQVLQKLKLSYFVPVIGLLQGLTDSVIGLSMGQTAEEVAFRFDISREAMDAFANESHVRAAAAYTNGWMEEVVPIVDGKGTLYSEDDGIRKDSSTSKLATLKPFFDKKYGMVTAGNSSQVTDGAALLVLASEEAVAQYQLPVMGKIVDTVWSGLNPTYMGLGPVHAMHTLMQRHNWGLNDIDAFEINEAFAAQVLGCLAAFEDAAYCASELGLTGAIGTLSREKLNQDGGAIALGHPVGASGARIVLHTLSVLKRTHGHRGIASICIGGGQGGAMVLESEK